MLRKKTGALFAASLLLVLLIVAVQAGAQVTTYIQNGEKYLADGSWAMAINEFKYALNYEPQNTNAWYGLGRAYEGLSGAKGAFDINVEALTGGTDAIAFKPDKDASANLEEAIRAFSNAASYYPVNLSAIAALGRAQYMAGRTQEAFYTLERGTVPYSLNNEALANMLYISMMAGDAQRFGTYSQIARNSTAAMSDQGVIHALAAAEVAAGNYKAAETLLTPLMYRYDLGYLPLKAMGDILFAQGRPMEALSFYKYAANANPKATGALTMTGDILSLTGDPTGASAAYRAALLANPASYWAKMGLARSFMELNDNTGALNVVKELLSKGGSDNQDTAYTLEAVLERALGQLQQAEISLKTALALNPSNQVAAYYLSLVQSEMRARGLASLTFPGMTLPAFEGFVINGGASIANNRKVTLSVNTTASYVSFKNENADYGTWSYKFGTSASYDWLLSEGDGKKSVRMRTREGLFSMAQEGPVEEILLDTTPPTVISREASYLSGNTFMMRVVAEEAMTGIGTFWMSADGTLWKPYRWMGGTFPFAFVVGASKVVTVAIVDGAGNFASFQTDISQYIPGPVITDVSAQETGTGKVTVRWTTDRLSSSYVEYKLGQSANVVGNESLVKSHVVDVTGLIPGQAYQFKPISVDSYGIKTEGQPVTLTLSAPVKPPTISGISVLGVTANTATISWNTDVPSYGYVMYSVSGQQISSQQVGPSTQNQVTLTGLMQISTYQFQVIAWDQQGRQAYSDMRSFTTSSSDRKSPTISNLRINGGAASTNNRTVGLELYATDDSGYVTEMSFKDDYSNWSAWMPYNTYSSFVLSDREGQRTVYARVKDAAGNISTEVTARIELDRTAPRISWVGAQAGLDNAEITWDTDESSDSWAFFGTSSSSLSYSQGQGDSVRSHRVFLTGLRPDTTYFYKVMSRDAAGNASESSVASFRTQPAMPADTKAPTGSVTINDGTTYTRSRYIYLNLYATDDRSSQGEIQFRVGEGASSYSITWGAWQAFAPRVQYTLGYGDGQRNVWVMYRDAAGNVSQIYGASVILDTKAPIITNLGVSNVTTTSAVINFTTNEPSFGSVEYGIATYSLSLASGESGVKSSSVSTAEPSSVIITPNPLPTRPGMTNFSINITGLKAGTTYYFRAVAMDIAGNTSATQVGSFNTLEPVPVDTKAPTGSVTINDNTRYTRSRYVYLNLYASDDKSPQSAIQYRVGEGISAYSISWGGWTQFASKVAYTLGYGDGQRNIWVMYRDAAGNVSQAYGASIVLDSKAPIITNLAASNITTSSATITWNTNEASFGSVEFGTSSSSLSSATGETGVRSSSISTAEPSSVVITPNPTGGRGGNTSFSLNITGLRADTTYYFRAVAMDLAGNIAASQTSSFRTASAVVAPPVVTPPIVTPPVVTPPVTPPVVTPPTTTPTQPTGVNLAGKSQGTKASTNGWSKANVAALAIDENMSSFWMSKDTATSSTPQWIEVTFGKTVAFNTVVMKVSSKGAPKDLKVFAMVNNKWTEVYNYKTNREGTGNPASSTVETITMSFSRVQATAVRLYYYDMVYKDEPTVLYEVEVYNR